MPHPFPPCTSSSLASALALSTQPGSLDTARGMIAAAVRTIAAKGIDSPETTVWLESARGMAALAGEDVPGSRDHFGRSWQAARTQPELFSPRPIVNFGQRRSAEHTSELQSLMRISY